MASPWLSVLVPAYNAEAYLRACVLSVVGQGVPGVEVRVLDDGSTDATADVVARLQSEHPHVVRVCRQAGNRGIAVARNDLLAQAQGRHVWFLDADDVLLPGAVAGVKRCLDQADPDLLMCDYRMLRDDFSLKHRLRGELHRRTFGGPSGVVSRDRDALVSGVLHNRELHVWSKIARRSLWTHVQFPEGRVFEDVAVMADLLSAADTHLHVPQVWVGYRQWPGSTLRTLSPERCRDLLFALQHMRQGFAAAPVLNAGTWFAIDHFTLRSVVSMASRLPLDAGSLRAEFREAVAGLFAGHLDMAIRSYYRRGWWMRALRARRVLAAPS